MLKFLRERKAQSTAEYAVLIGLVVAAAITMQTYVKRGLQGKTKDASDNYYTKLTTDAGWAAVGGATATAIKGGQFEPGLEGTDGRYSHTTEDTSQDKETYVMNKDGTTSRESTRKSKNAANDWSQQDYTGVK